ncbi:hypothetical protein ACFZDK_18380 [Streptomyces sp. NPDC007901]|uniref:hypothetical protein n=1 Tax=Streptomyces sp. NPDC007901 TaxID=3364785 RepID=UPI0036EEFA65
MSTQARNVVLVHGGFVDGSGRQGVYDALKRDGYHVSIALRLVLPDLSARRLVARPLPGTALRTTLGLERPANRFATTAVPEEAR